MKIVRRDLARLVQRRRQPHRHGGSPLALRDQDRGSEGAVGIQIHSGVDDLRFAQFYVAHRLFPFSIYFTVERRREPEANII